MADERRAATSSLRFLLGGFCLVVLLGCLATLIGFLPPSNEALFGWKLALLIAAAGGLGASIHAATSFTHHAGVGTLGPEWSWWFILRPALGAALGMLFVFVVTGLGVGDALGTASNSTPQTLATYLAWAGLAGMFSRQAIDWLRGIFDRLFRVADNDEETDKKVRLSKIQKEAAPAKHDASAEASSPPREEDAYGALWRRFVPLYVAGMLVLLAATIALTCVASRMIGTSPPPASLECLLSLLVTLAAALGATIHVFTSIAEFAGRRRLTTDWLWWYILRPFIAAALGLLVYFGARALWTPTIAGPSELYGLLVVALLAGAFSKQTIRWLSGLVDAVFRKVEGLEQGGE